MYLSPVHAEEKQIWFPRDALCMNAHYL